ncbi:MAG TPA: FmdB family zinc ribbon protein [Ignavibacteria bacterium]|jgi:putative FmdB family regulatory protein
MPIYEYHCDNCNYDFELLQSVKESHSAICPICNKTANKKISLPGGLVFKGSGFYITDYSKSNGNGGSHSSITDNNNGKKNKTSGNGSDNGNGKKSSEKQSKIETTSK